MNGDNITYFHSFGVEYIPKKDYCNNLIKKWKQENESVMCGYLCIGFIGFRLEAKN